MTAPVCCPACGGRSEDGLVCTRCARFAVNDLAAIIELWPDLEITMSRQARQGAGGPPARSAVTPLPFHEPAALVLRDVRLALVAWMRTFDLGDALSSTNPAAICQWLAERSERFRSHLVGDRFVDEIADCARRMVRVIDVPPLMIYLGTCTEITDVQIDDRGDEREILCGADLYARPSDLTHECRACHIVYDVPARRAEIIRRSLSHAGTVHTCATVLAAFGLPVAVDTLQNWARPKRRRNHHTGQLETVAPPRLSPVGTNKHGQRLFSLADVEALAREMMQIRDDKARRRRA